MDIKLTFNWLPIVGSVMVLLAYYLPGFKDWYEKLAPTWKQGVMMLVLAVIAFGAAVLSVLGVVSVYPATWGTALWYALVDFVIALLANAGIYKATNKINDSVVDRIENRRSRRTD